MELSLLGVVSIVFLITALGSAFNSRFMNWPNTIAVMLLSTILSLSLVVLSNMGYLQIGGLGKFMQRMHFEDLLLHWMLPVLLFAGALHVSVTDLRTYKFQIFTFVTLGLVISASLMALAITSFAPYFGFSVTFLQAMVFGVLISSTDPVCVLGILNKGNVSKSLKAKVTGESLFNDETAVVLFLTLVAVAFNANQQSTIEHLDYLHIAKNFAYESLGGTILGLACAFGTSFLTRLVDAYDVEILITLALAFGTYALAEGLHVSAPIAVVVAGLYIGNRTIKKFMSDKSREHVNTFWHLIDDILNAVLFVLMGLILVLFELTIPMVLFSVVMIVVMIAARYVSILGSAVALIPLKMTNIIKTKVDLKKTPIVMTWCGLRGGISIALALSIPDTFPQVKQLFLVMTFVCVFFSIFVQGLTLPKFLQWVNKGISENDTVKIEAPEPTFADPPVASTEKL